MEQMLLCTLLPFSTDGLPPFHELIEANVIIQWRYQEVRFSNATGTVIMQLNQLTHKNWIHLVNLPYCRVMALMSCVPGPTGPIILAPQALRVYINRDAFGPREQISQKLCEPNVMSFENFLSDALKTTPYCIEIPPETGRVKRRPAFDLSPKKYEVTSAIQINGTNLWWHFDRRIFALHPGYHLTVNVRPTVLVSDACSAYVNHVLGLAVATVPRKRLGPLTSTAFGHIAANQAVLVFTQRPEVWATSATAVEHTCTTAMPSGLSMSDLSNAQIITCDTTTWAENIALGSVLLDCVETAINCSTHTVTEDQVRRVLIDNLCAKFDKFVVPLHMIQFGVVIIDGIDVHDAVLKLLTQHNYLRIIQIAHSKALKPRSLSQQSASNAFSSGIGPSRGTTIVQDHNGEHLVYAGIPHWFTASLWAACENHMQIVPVPKHILRRIKIIGHAVKNGAIEDRISKCFAGSYCPLPLADAIQRFSNKPIPLDVCQGLINRHFDRLETSLGAFVSKTHVDSLIGVIRKDYALAQLTSTDKSCSICYDTMNSTFCMSLCGHMYCKDCAKQYFNAEWASFKSWPCASCRNPLLQGDFFHVESMDTFVPAMTSKNQAVETLLLTLRHPAEVYTKEWTYSGSMRHLIITEPAHLKAQDLLQKMMEATQTVNVHVFYMPEEAAAYQALASSF